MTALDLIYEGIKKGTVYGKIEEHRLGGTYFWDVLGKSLSGNIWWRHAGSSCNKMSKKELAWILSVIFEMSPAEFLAQHTTYAEFKRISGIYEKRGEAK